MPTATLAVLFWLRRIAPEFWLLTGSSASAAPVVEYETTTATAPIEPLLGTVALVECSIGLRAGLPDVGDRVIGRERAHTHDFR